MDKETLEKLTQRGQALGAQLEELPYEDAAALYFRAYAMHLVETADRLNMGDIAYGLVAAATMSHELNRIALELQARVMSMPLEGQSLDKVRDAALDAECSRFIELLEKVCAASTPMEGDKDGPGNS